MNIKYIIAILLLSTSLLSCKEDKKVDDKKAAKTVLKDLPTAEPTKQVQENKRSYPAPAFPTMGPLDAAYFVPQNYAIDFEAEGDLNQDGLKDLVLVLVNKRDSTDLRTTIVLLRQGEKYSLAEQSQTVVAPSYRDDGFQDYFNESANIEKGVLSFNMFGSGVSGNLSSSYQYTNNELVLISASQFSAGAGAQTEVNVDLIKGTFAETNTNTMKEDMPSETTSKKYKAPKVLFKNCDPKAVISDAMDATETEF